MFGLSEKYKHYIYYCFFGVLTTLVNVVVYWIVAHLMSIATVPSSIIAWVAAVSFAYITNRKWVFESENTKALDIIREIVYFFSCRLGTGVLDWIIMYVSVDLMHINDLIMKITANIVVIVLNYIASKFIIFKKHNNKGLN